MTQLLHKGVSFVWSESKERSFNELRERLVSAPVLAMPVPEKDYTVYTDASRVCFGCVLMQEDHVIAYGSRQLRPQFAQKLAVRSKKEKKKEKPWNTPTHQN